MALKITNYLKYLPWLLVCIAMGYVAYYQYRAAENARALLKIKDSKLLQANLEVGRANTKMVEQDQAHDLAIREIDKRWKEEIKKREALVTLYASLEGKYNAVKNKVKVQTKVVYKDKEVPLPPGQFFHKDEDGKLSEIFAMPLFYEDFRITILGDAISQILSYKLHQTFRGKFVETRLASGIRNHYFELVELDEQGKVAGKVKLTNFQVIRTYEELENKWMWWNPKLDLSLGFGMTQHIEANWVGDIGISLSAYGKTSDDLQWRFFRFSTGITGHGYSLAFSPALFNLGKHLPLVSNIWLMSFGGYDFGAAAAHFGMGISVVF